MIAAKIGPDQDLGPKGLVEGTKERSTAIHASRDLAPNNATLDVIATVADTAQRRLQVLQ